MATLYKTVMQNGSGDYTDFVTGVADILASGLAATGYYTDYVLNVDNAEYSGYFDANVPYSGFLHIIGSGTWWTPSAASTVSGESPMALPNIEIEGFYINATNTTNIFSVYSGSAFALTKTDLLETTNGIVSSGKLFLDNVTANGLGQGCFISDYGYSSIASSRVSNFASGIFTADANISDTVFIDNIIHIIGYSGIVVVAGTLIYGGSSGIFFDRYDTTASLYINNSTISVPSPIVLSGTIIQIQESILNGDTFSIYGSGSGIIDASIMYPSGALLTSNITETNVLNSDPKFKDSANGDFRLKFRQVTGSPAVEIKDKELFSNEVTLTTEQTQFNIYDKKGTARTSDFTPFIYKQGNTLLISDYMKETKFADVMNSYSDLEYSVQMNANFEVSGVATRAAMNTISNPFPYDWDYRTFNTAEITDRHRYIIPRTVVDITETIAPYVGSFLSSFQFNSIDKRAITPYMFSEYKGIAYDANLSVPGKGVTWMIEGLNQMLVKTNIYTGERLAEYPLFVPNISGHEMVKPSGLIFVGVNKDQYKFVLESDPNIELVCDNANGYFKWISTDIDPHKDARGIIAYKDNLFITITKYHPQTIYDRTTTPLYDGSVGALVRYDNNNTFEHYIAGYTTSGGPTGFILDSGNAFPTDLTVYEDGSLLIADWATNDWLYKYRLAYDYALVQSSYDTETRIILRENYDSVEL